MADDLYRASEARTHFENATHALIVLPDAAWSRRVAGTLGNRLAQQYPARAHAVLTPRTGGYLVSVRAPLIVVAPSAR